MDAEKLLGDVQSIELAVAMLNAAFTNGEALSSIGLLRNQIACLQVKVQGTRRRAETLAANINIHNTLHH
jgi:hypothetical protein